MTIRSRSLRFPYGSKFKPFAELNQLSYRFTDFKVVEPKNTYVKLLRLRKEITINRSLLVLGACPAASLKCGAAAGFMLLRLLEGVYSQ
jgi:hypothetical protein